MAVVTTCCMKTVLIPILVFQIVTHSYLNESGEDLGKRSPLSPALSTVLETFYKINTEKRNVFWNITFSDLLVRPPFQNCGFWHTLYQTSGSFPSWKLLFIIIFFFRTERIQGFCWQMF